MNKNTRSLRVAISSAIRKDKSELTYEQPVPNYHSANGNPYSKRTLVLSSRKADGEVSRSAARNMRMVVSHNEDAKGVKSSLTSHVPIHTDRPVRFKNHGYINETLQGYKQPAQIRA